MGDEVGKGMERLLKATDARMENWSPRAVGWGTGAWRVLSERGLCQRGYWKGPAESRETWRTVQGRSKRSDASVRAGTMGREWE